MKLKLLCLKSGGKIHLSLDKLFPLLERNPWRYKPSKNSKCYDVTCHIYSYIHKSAMSQWVSCLFIINLSYNCLENGIITYSCVFFLHCIFSKTASDMKMQQYRMSQVPLKHFQRHLHEYILQMYIHYRVA